MMSPAADYRVSLPLFEGPLDLLLHLIKKEDLDIYNIPIAKLLDQYLSYLECAQELNIDLAGEFVEMASELAYIKSRTLLPSDEEEVEEGPDPREELARRLLEYQRYKEAAQKLYSRPLLGQDVFARMPVIVEEEDDKLEIEIDTLSLISAFQDLLKKLPSEKVHEIQNPRVGVSERILELTEILKTKKEILFSDLFFSNATESAPTRTDLVVTFLAILEMAKQRLLRVLQNPANRSLCLYPLFSTESEEKELDV